MNPLPLRRVSAAAVLLPFVLLIASAPAADAAVTTWPAGYECSIETLVIEPTTAPAFTWPTTKPGAHNVFSVTGSGTAQCGFRGQGKTPASVKYGVAAGEDPHNNNDARLYQCQTGASSSGGLFAVTDAVGNSYAISIAILWLEGMSTPSEPALISTVPAARASLSAGVISFVPFGTDRCGGQPVSHLVLQGGSVAYQSTTSCTDDPLCVEVVGRLGDAVDELVDDPMPDSSGYSYTRGDPFTPGDDGSASGTWPENAGTPPCTPDAETGDVCQPLAPTSSDVILDQEGAEGVAARVGARSLDPGGSGWGMSVQPSLVLDDPDLRRLGVRQVRRVVPWDVALRPFKDTACGPKGDPGGSTAEYADLKNWVRKAKASGAEILISFGHCKQGTEWDVLPKPSQYKEAILRFMRNRNFQGIRWFTSWNEPNHKEQPTSVTRSGSLFGAFRAGQYWRVFNRLCRSPDYPFSCSVAAGEFLDDASFNASYFNEYKRGLGGRQPTVWAFHAYSTGQQNNYSRWDQFRRSTSRPDAPDPKI